MLCLYCTENSKIPSHPFSPYPSSTQISSQNLLMHLIQNTFFFHLIEQCRRWHTSRHVIRWHNHTVRFQSWTGVSSHNSVRTRHREQFSPGLSFDPIRQSWRAVQNATCTLYIHKCLQKHNKYDMMIWWYDDTKIWWYDDMMVRRYDDTMIQVLSSVMLHPGQRNTSPLCKIIFLNYLLLWFWIPAEKNILSSPRSKNNDNNNNLVFIHSLY